MRAVYTAIRMAPGRGFALAGGRASRERIGASRRARDLAEAALADYSAALSTLRRREASTLEPWHISSDAVSPAGTTPSPSRKSP